MTLTFINQSALDIKRKLQRLECLRKKGIKDLVVVAEKVFNVRTVQRKRKLQRSSTRTNTLLLCCWP